LVVASVLGFLIPGSDATAGLQLSVASHPHLQDRAGEMMAMIRMVDVADRNLRAWATQFTNSWNAYKTHIVTNKEEKYCKGFKALLEELSTIQGHIELVRSGIAAKKYQLDQIKSILNGVLSAKSGIHCKEGSEQPICKILDNLEAENTKEEDNLEREEDLVEAEIEAVTNHKCDCTYEPWGPWSQCDGEGVVTKESPLGCGEGTQERSRELKWDLRNGGKECGDKTEERNCDAGCCPVDCKYTEWGDWSMCPEHCDGKEYTVEKHRSIEVQPECGGKTCEEAHQDGHGTTWTKPCNILQVKTEILSGLDAEIASLEMEKGELKHRMCSPNPCENNGHCDTTETLTEGVLIPSASCRCSAGITGPRCGTKVEGY